MFLERKKSKHLDFFVWGVENLVCLAWPPYFMQCPCQQKCHAAYYCKLCCVPPSKSSGHTIMVPFLAFQAAYVCTTIFVVAMPRWHLIRPCVRYAMCHLQILSAHAISLLLKAKIGLATHSLLFALSLSSFLLASIFTIPLILIFITHSSNTFSIPKSIFLNLRFKEFKIHLKISKC